MFAGSGIAVSEREGWVLPVSLITGVLSAHLFTALPPPWLISSFAALAALLLLWPGTRWGALALLACCWSLYNLHLRVEDRLDPALAGEVVNVTGVITTIPFSNEDFSRFSFRPDSDHQADGFPGKLLLYWYRDWPELSVGERWQLELKVKPPWGGVNFHGTDKERWLFTEGIGGLGTVRSGKRVPGSRHNLLLSNTIREDVLQRISEQVSDPRQRGVVQALATADRGGLDPDDRRLLAVTGTSHLLAISGLHIGLAAAGGIWLSRLLLLFFSAFKTGRSTVLLSIGGGLLAAAAYSALAGFGTPTVRAVLMLATAMLALLLGRTIHPLRAWVLSLAVILIIEPLSPLGAGLWFSFLAVAALLFVFLPRNGPISWWKTLLMAQTGVVLVLLPVSATWFYSFTPSSFLANLLAIPWVSTLVVPPVLAGLVVLPISDALAGNLWSVAGIAISLLFQYLGFIDRFQGQLSMLAPPTSLQYALALAGSFLLLLPRGIPGRWLGMFLLVPLFFPPAPRTPEGSVEMEVLDVGQGTAVLLSSGGHSLLYDSGPGDGESHNLVAGVIAPALARLGRGAPGQIIISHGDMDHAGGLGSLLKLYSEASYHVNLGREHPKLPQCNTLLSWDWPGVELRALHPTPGLPYLGNDSSCVISVSSSGTQLLLSGDISRQAENRLLVQGVSPHQVLLVPHHGSKSSSSAEFIQQLRPGVAIATASLGNRFNFPRAEIRNRYEAQGVKFWSTGECGALRLLIGPDGQIEASSARRQRLRVWRWAAAENCP